MGSETWNYDRLTDRPTDRLRDRRFTSNKLSFYACLHQTELSFLHAFAHFFRNFLIRAFSCLYVCMIWQKACWEPIAPRRTCFSFVEGCKMYRVFFEYCVFANIPDSGLSRFPLGGRVCTQWQVKHQHCSRTGRVQKNHNILRENIIFNEHPVAANFATPPPLPFHNKRIIL